MCLCTFVCVHVSIHVCVYACPSQHVHVCVSGPTVGPHTCSRHRLDSHAIDSLMLVINCESTLCIQIITNLCAIDHCLPGNITHNCRNTRAHRVRVSGSHTHTHTLSPSLHLHISLTTVASPHATWDSDREFKSTQTAVHTWVAADKGNTFTQPHTDIYTSKSKPICVTPLLTRGKASETNGIAT